MADVAELVRRAEDYPFDPPLESFVFGGDPAELALDGRIPVLAAGSNASPQQLARKFGPHAGAIPVLRALLYDRVVVYSAHFSSYGAVPATLAEAPGSASLVFVTWLDESQLEVMHASEATGRNYDFVELEMTAEVDRVGRIERAFAYLSRAGPLRLRARPVRLAEIPTAACPWPALFQAALLRLLHRRLAADRSYEAFVAELVRDEAYRARATRALAMLDG